MNGAERSWRADCKMVADAHGYRRIKDEASGPRFMHVTHGVGRAKKASPKFWAVAVKAR